MKCLSFGKLVNRRKGTAEANVGGDVAGDVQQHKKYPHEATGIEWENNCKCYACRDKLRDDV